MYICLRQRSRQSEYQRSYIKLRNLVFQVGEDASLWAHWNSFLSSVPQRSEANPVSWLTLLLALPQLHSSPHGRCHHPLDSTREPSFTFGDQKLLMIRSFLFINTAGDIFSSHFSPSFPRHCQNTPQVKFTLNMVSSKLRHVLTIGYVDVGSHYLTNMWPVWEGKETIRHCRIFGRDKETSKTLQDI